MDYKVLMIEVLLLSIKKVREVCVSHLSFLESCVVNMATYVASNCKACFFLIR